MSGSRRCDSVSRRDVVRVGGLTALGFGLGQFFQAARARVADPRLAPNATSCILIWLDGGPSHLETFDPKPDAPEEVRGPFGTIATSIPGVRLGECLERTATVLDQLAIVRSMTSPLGEHNLGTHYVLTGYAPTPALEYPSFGATVAHVRENPGVLPPNIAIPQFTGNLSGHGYLPGATRPFAVGGDPARPDFKVRDLDLAEGLDVSRLARRHEFAAAVDALSRARDAAPSAQTDPDLERAFDLITSPEAKGAFNLHEEDDRLRARYGRDGGNSIGQSCLLARRLIERGVPFVTVTSSGWDSHANIVQLKERYRGDQSAHLPSLDRALSALIEDLTDRGMLDETLVVVMGEFGRTPKMNSNGGRDHWPNVFSVVLAGGGVRGGQVIGGSDSLAEYPDHSPVTPADLAATIYTLLGIDPKLELQTSDGRPVRVAPEGARIVRDLIA
ncbi:DUF1501 domain-containing protein [Tautonia rosea]|uniref:DUF1501 domain-containing protein n=1 Tax=Tautonia rosea TaxID=2728037 RepID=UPI0014755B35|nr:DUF1501 domain-containing protein [Tautonia rosea]